MDPANDAVAALFDRVADTYDAVGVDLFGPVAERLVAAVDPRPGERVLDVGCGPGAVLFRLAEAVGAEGRATGIDLSPRMIESAAALAASSGLTLDLRQADAQAPGLEPASFDLIASSLVLFFLADPAAALVAWHELLVAGGRIGVSTFGPYTAAWHEVDDLFRSYQSPEARDPRMVREGDTFSSDAGVESLVASAGFRDIRTETFVQRVRFADEDQWHRWTWSIGQRRMWERVAKGERDELRKRANERLDRCRDEDGRIGFDQVVRLTLARR